MADIKLMVNEQSLTAGDPIQDSKRFAENRYHQILTKYLHFVLSLYALVKSSSPAFFIPEVIFRYDPS